jgi:hypothetical protein
MNTDTKNTITIKDEGDFFQTKLTLEGNIPQPGKMYPFGSLVTRTFCSKNEAKEFASKIGFKIQWA